MNNYQIFRKIQERDNIIKKYSNDTKEDLIDLVIEKDNIIENLQSKIDKANKILDKYAKTEVEDYKEIIKFYKELRNVLKEDKWTIKK